MPTNAALEQQLLHHLHISILTWTFWQAQMAIHQLRKCHDITSSHPLDAQAVERINSSVSKTDIKRHEAWLKEFGSV